MRRMITAGNWKMNKTPKEAVALINELIPVVKSDDTDVVFCVPAVSLMAAVEATKGTNIEIGAQTMHFEENGAYTGEIAPSMLNKALPNISLSSTQFRNTLMISCNSGIRTCSSSLSSRNSTFEKSKSTCW